MARFYGLAGRVCACLGLALLVCSLVLVPSTNLFADDGGSLGPGPHPCDVNCNGTTPPCGGKLCNAIVPQCDIFGCFWVGSPQYNWCECTQSSP